MQAGQTFYRTFNGNDSNQFLQFDFRICTHSYVGHAKVSEVLCMVYMGNKFRKLNRDLTGDGLF